MTHACPGPECKRDNIPDEYLMCSTHWYQVPKPLQRAVWAAYNKGAGVGSPALRAAQLAAVRSLLQGGR
jgi:hypothetical protein